MAGCFRPPLALKISHRLKVVYGKICSVKPFSICIGVRYTFRRPIQNIMEGDYTELCRPVGTSEHYFKTPFGQNA